MGALCWVFQRECLQSTREPLSGCAGGAVKVASLRRESTCLARPCLQGYTEPVDSVRPEDAAKHNTASPEALYSASVPIAHRKRLGQFFTPPAIARFMVRWAVTAQTSSFLDPAAGTGVFLEEASRTLRPSAVMVGWELDPALADLTKSRVPACTIRVGDFLLQPASCRYDAVVCNPPYVRHRALRYPDSVWRTFDTLAGRRLSRFTNAYGLFLIAIAHALSPRGRAAVIIPAEFLNADFAVPIKAFLLSRNFLDAVIAFDHRDLIFGDAVTTACIILLRTSRRAGEHVSLVRADRVEHPDELDHALSQPALSLDPQELDPRRKWEPLLRPQAPPACGDLVRLGMLARCIRGIATGANSYFTLNWPEVQRFGLAAHVRPCITKTMHAPAPVFTPQDHERLVRSGRKAFLLWPTDPHDGSLAAYLDVGHRLGIPSRYLPSHRNPWYMPERRDSAPIWVAAFGRGRIRVVLNQARVHNLTAFHGLYPRALTDAQTRALFAFLCSPPGQAGLEAQLRRYGAGLLKLEPRDVERVLVPDVRALAPDALGELMRLTDRLARGEDTLAEIDAVFRAQARQQGA